MNLYSNYPLLKIYHNEMPDFLMPFIETDEMQRLNDVGMNCGCEYTSFDRFRKLKKYSRLYHSIGCALIAYHFTRDSKQAISALFHDISTPTFAHSVDFLYGDYMTQESTEDDTELMIRSSEAICSLLDKNGIDIEEIKDYHIYPICDNDSPRLSSDRLEYSFGNMYNFLDISLETLKRYYEDLTIEINEDGIEELCFNNESIASEFTLNALKCAKIYVCDEDRYSMQRISEILKAALCKNVITKKDLYGTESTLIEKLKHDEIMSIMWNNYINMNQILTDCDESDPHARKIFAKKRYIDPLVKGKGRISNIDKSIFDEIESFRSQDQDYFVSLK